MRTWIVTVALVAAALVVPTRAFAAPTPAPTVAKQASPVVATAAPAAPNAPAATVAPAKPSSTAGVVAKPTAPPPTPTPPPPTATAVPATAVPATPMPAPAKPTSAPVAKVTPQKATLGAGVVQGVVFYDTNADGESADGDAGVGDLEVTLQAQNGGRRTTHTDEDGAFRFEALRPGTYHVTIALPTDTVGTTDTAQDVIVAGDGDAPDMAFGLVVPPEDVLRAMHGLPAEDEATETTDASDDQVMALSAVTSLPLRFAEGRDLMAQVGRRVLGDGLVWLGVPFRTQIDGGEFQYVNCGPASLTMVLAAFGLEVGPSQVRDYLNSLIDNYNTDLGTSLDVLARIGKLAGLTPLDLYSDAGGYRYWSTDAVRWHVQQGRPVITLVKYRNLPGHGQSLSEFDHYIVISGLTPNGFIYNDAAFSSTLGYGLEISDVELQYAWENSSIPHHAVAFGLAPDAAKLSFPEMPRRVQALPPDLEALPARASRRLAAQDEVERAPLTIVPMPRPAGPLITVSDRWQDEVEAEPPIDDGAPMGLTMNQSEQPTVEARPGPGAMMPKLLVLAGGAWLLFVVWAFSGRLVRWRPRLRLR